MVWEGSLLPLFPLLLLQELEELEELLRDGLLFVRLGLRFGKELLRDGLLFVRLGLRPELLGRELERDGEDLLKDPPRLRPPLRLRPPPRLPPPRLPPPLLANATEDSVLSHSPGFLLVRLILMASNRTNNSRVVAKS